jgi:hypothetical protein
MKNPIEHFGFDQKNYKWLFIGLAINVLGYILMIGGGAENLNEFKEEELFSPIRITLSPILIVGGYVIILFSIMKRQNSDDTTVTEKNSSDELTSSSKKSK